MDDPIDYGLFVAFFPQLVAGPIETSHASTSANRAAANRASQNLGKHRPLSDSNRPGAQNWRSPTLRGGWSIGCSPTRVPTRRCSLGLAQCCIRFKSTSSSPATATSHAKSARMMGLDAIRKLRHPYFATNPADFWRRWHISLSTWVRDYLFIPLGGNRSGLARTCLNLVVSLTLSGLWHGAAWNFVAWGFAHGLLLAAHRVYREWRGEADSSLPSENSERELGSAGGPPASGITHGQADWRR